MRHRPSHMQPHPAPDRLRLVQDLINTRSLETGADDLDNPRAFEEWLAHRQLLTADASLSETEWRQGLEVREVVRNLVHRNRGRALKDADVEAFNRLFGEVRPGLRLTRAGSLGLVNTAEGWLGALSQLVLIIFQEMQSERWRRLKLCHEEKCRAAFYDSSRNRSGKWCTAIRCGNRIHSRLHQRRLAKYRREPRRYL